MLCCVVLLLGSIVQILLWEYWRLNRSFSTRNISYMFIYSNWTVSPYVSILNLYSPFSCWKYSFYMIKIGAHSLFFSGHHHWNYNSYSKWQHKQYDKPNRIDLKTWNNLKQQWSLMIITMKNGVNIWLIQPSTFFCYSQSWI